MAGRGRQQSEVWPWQLSKGCLVLVGNDIELDTVGRQFEPGYHGRPCSVTWDAVSEQSWLLKLRQISAYRTTNLSNVAMGAIPAAARHSRAVRTSGFVQILRSLALAHLGQRSDEGPRSPTLNFLARSVARFFPRRIPLAGPLQPCSPIAHRHSSWGFVQILR